MLLCITEIHFHKAEVSQSFVTYILAKIVIIVIIMVNIPTGVNSHGAIKYLLMPQSKIVTLEVLQDVTFFVHNILFHLLVLASQIGPGCIMCMKGEKTISSDHLLCASERSILFK